MAVVFCDSFQHYNDTQYKYTTAGGSFNTTPANLRHGPQSLQVTSASAPTISFTALGNSGLPITEGLVNIAWQAGHLSGRIFTLQSGGVDQLWVQLHADGSLSVETSLGTLGTSAAGVIVLNDWNYIAVKIVIDPALGSVILRVTDAANVMTELLNLSNVDTDPVGTLFFDGVAFGGPTSSFAWAQDFIIQNSGDFLGAAYVNALVPIADGATITAGWTPALPHFSLVNEIPPDNGATQIQIQENVLGANAAETYHYDFSGLPALPIACIQSVADSNDAVILGPLTLFGVGAAIALISDPSTNATTASPPRNTLIADSVFFMDISAMNVNPLTALPWTAADLLDIQIGAFFGDLV